MLYLNTLHTPVVFPYLIFPVFLTLVHSCNGTLISFSMNAATAVWLSGAQKATTQRGKCSVQCYRPIFMHSASCVGHHAHNVLSMNTLFIDYSVGNLIGHCCRPIGREALNRYNRHP